MATPPRQILPSTTYLIERTTSELRFFLLPHKELNQAFLYCLAYTAKRHSILVHEYMVLRNRCYLEVTDRFGTLPEFMQDLDSLSARCINSLLNRKGSFWSPGSYITARNEQPFDAIEQSTYILASPVAAGLVRYTHRWTGCNSLSLDYGQSISTTRLDSFFSNHMPKSVTLTLSRPDTLLELTNTQLRNKVQRALREKVHSIGEDFTKQNHRFTGIKRVMKQHWSDSPASLLKKMINTHTIESSHSNWAHIQRKQKNKPFHIKYEVGRQKLKLATNKVAFPLGTYELVAAGIVTALGS